MTSASAVIELGTNPSSLTCADASFTLLKAASASITNLTATSLVLSNLSIASANVTTLTSASATITNLFAASGTITTGNLNFSSTAQRITGDMSNGTVSNRLFFQTSTANSNTNFGLITNGTGTQSQYTANNSSDPANASRLRVGVDNQSAFIVSDISGTGSYFPITFSTNGSEQMRLTSTGLGIGTSSPNYSLTSYKGGAVANYLQVASGATGAGAANGLLLGVDSSGNSVINAQGGAVNLYTYVAGVLRTTIVSSGNLGLGVTPSAWYSTFRAFQFGGYGSSVFGRSENNSAGIASNSYVDSAGNWKYINSNFASYYQQINGQHQFNTAASGTAGNAITFTQAMTLDASGNLVVGGTSATSLGANVASISVNATAANSTGGVVFQNSGSQTARVAVLSGWMSLQDLGSANGISIDEQSALPIQFKTNGTERARITSGGFFKASNDGNYLAGGSNVHEIRSTEAALETLIVTSSNASFTSIVGFFRANRNTTNNTFNALAYYNDAAAAYRFFVADSGNVTNTNGSYGTISDAKMKTDIVDAGSQWDDLKAVRFRKFKMKDDPSGLMQLGVVAQELEQTSPGLVEEHKDRDVDGNDLGTTTKSVKTSVLLMKAAVALQEAMARIEQLEAKVAALETK